MKAAIIEKPGVLTVKEIPPPPIGEYDVLCAMLYGATCSGTDQHLISGRLPINYPAVLGHESIGRIIEVGSKVRHYKKGDLVTRVGTTASPRMYIAWGGFAEYGIARDHWALHEDGVPRQQWNGSRVNQVIPSDMDPAAATMIITWRETFSYISRMGVKQGAAVLVIGSGGNGLAFANHANNLAAAPVVMVGSKNRRHTAGSVGTTDYFDYQEENLLEAISQKYPAGFDFIIDAVGKTGLADRALSHLKPHGTLGIYGIDDYGQCTLNPSNSKGTFTFYNGGYDEEEAHQQVMTAIGRGFLKAETWLDFDRIFPLEDIQKAFDWVHARKAIKALVQLQR